MTELQNNNDSNNPIYWRQRIYFYLTFKVDLKGEYMFNWLLSHFTIFIGFCFIFIPAQSHGYKRSKYFYQILLTPLMDVNVDIVIFPSWPSISRSIVLTDIARLMSMSLILNKKIWNGHFWQNRLYNSEYAWWTLKYHKDLVRSDRKGHIRFDICDRRSPSECIHGLILRQRNFMLEKRFLAIATNNSLQNMLFSFWVFFLSKIRNLPKKKKNGTPSKANLSIKI